MCRSRGILAFYLFSPATVRHTFIPLCRFPYPFLPDSAGKGAFNSSLFVPFL